MVAIFVVGIIVLLFCAALFGEPIRERGNPWLALVLIVLPSLGGGCFGGFMEWHCSREWYDGYVAQKRTIEAVFSEPGLSVLERGALAKEACELNGKLAGRAYNARQWYGFLDDPRVIDAEPVRLTAAEKPGS